MPQGKGTYGSKVGRPPKKNKKEHPWQEKGVRKLPKDISKKRKRISLGEVKIKGKRVPLPQAKDEYPSYDAGGRVERVMGYGDGGEVKHSKFNPGDTTKSKKKKKKKKKKSVKKPGSIWDLYDKPKNYKIS